MNNLHQIIKKKKNNNKLFMEYEDKLKKMILEYEYEYI